MQSTKCYHGLTIMFNLETLRLIVDLGMLNVSLAFAKSICPLSLKKYLNAWHLILMTTFLFPYITQIRNIFPEILKQHLQHSSLFVMREALRLTENE